jgi:peptide/nickel transport system substrate-binding protein
MITQKKWLAGLSLALLFIFATLFVVRPPTGDLVGSDVIVEDVEVGDRRGALVDEIVFTQEADINKIAELIEGGSHQVFALGITNATTFRRIRDSSHTDHSISYGSTGEITVNPAGPTFNDGRINPFHVPEIREALNWLVNRRHVAEELYGGLAVPRYLAVSTAFPDYARLADVARAIELQYAYEPERARRVIRREMEKLGATLERNRWTHQGAPVRLTILIRTEDERRRVGDYLANLLEDSGFEVERLYRSAEEASRIWILGDPSDGRWHLYTGSWVSTLIMRDQADQFTVFYTPRGRPEPLWQIYQPAPEFDQLADRLQRRDYTTWDERQEMMGRALELAMKDSVRIWLVDQINVWPRSRKVSLASDLAGGVSASALWPYTIRYRDRVGGRVVFGTPSLLTEPWNPVAGSNWLFDTMIQRSLEDMPLIPDPFTGLFWPQRIESAAVTVQAGVPVIRTHDWVTVEEAEEIVVPEDAWIDWDAGDQRFVTVGERHPDGVRARTRTTIRYEDGYLDRRWHDRTKMSMADLLVGWILSRERAKEESRLHDAAHQLAFEAYQRHYRGWRILSEQPLEIEVYSDQIFPDAEVMVNNRALSVSPWHTLGLGIRAEHNGELAFSSNKADRMRVDWLSYVAGPSLPILNRHLQEAQADAYVPFPKILRKYVTDAEVEARYSTLADWYEARRHFWVGAGPFYLHSAHPVERSVVIRRFEDFPDRSDKWLRFARPEIPALDLDGPMVLELGEEGAFDLHITFDGKPYPVEAIDMARYMVFNGRGQLAYEGDIKPTANGSWSISLSADQLAELGSGANSLEVAVSSERVAMPIFATHVFATVPERRAETGSHSTK